MLRFLFPRLTAEPALGTELFAAISATARAPHWYVEGGAPDTLDGRFAMLATIAALVIVRLERSGNHSVSVALTERFIEVMEAEHRELGLGDPGLGRTVRKLVASLARRVDLWRDAIEAGDWHNAARLSVWSAVEPAGNALAHTADRLGRFWSSLAALPDAALAEGRLE